MENILSLGIIATGVYFILIGLVGVYKKQMRLMPINRRKVLVGQDAVKEGKRLLFFGVLALLIGILFLIK